MKKLIMTLLTLCLVFGIFCLSGITVKAEDFNPDVPDDIDTYCELAGEEFGFDANILKAMCWQETRYAAHVNNEGTYKGPMQCNPVYYQEEMELIGVTDITDPYSNIRLAAYCLRYWLDTYGDGTDVKLALECWNEGYPTALSHHTEKGTYYSRNIVANAEILAEIELQEEISVHKNVDPEEDLSSANNESTTPRLRWNGSYYIVDSPDVIPAFMFDRRVWNRVLV